MSLCVFAKQTHKQTNKQSPANQLCFSDQAHKQSSRFLLTPPDKVILITKMFFKYFSHLSPKECYEPRLSLKCPHALLHTSSSIWFIIRPEITPASCRAAWHSFQSGFSCAGLHINRQSEARPREHSSCLLIGTKWGHLFCMKPGSGLPSHL